jgi:hypothetical protein
MQVQFPLAGPADFDAYADLLSAHFVDLKGWRPQTNR